MKSRYIERPGDDAGSRSAWARKVILGGLGTAGASIAMAAFAASAFANAANPTSASSTETVNNDGTVSVTVSGNWSWGELAGVQTSPQKDCAGRSGVGWSVDWWGMSNSATPAAGKGPTSGSLVNPATSKTTPPSPTSGSLSVAGTWQVKSGPSAGQYFHTSHQFNGFLADLCNNATPTPTGPVGTYSATALYPSISAVPAQICVNFYDPHGSQGSYSTSAGDNFADQAGDNSIKTNSFDPTLVTGNCSVPVLQNPSVKVDKTNNASGNGFQDSSTAPSLNTDVPFKVVITNSSTVNETITSVTDAIPTGSGANSVDCITAGGTNVVNNVTLTPNQSVTCFFTKTNYLAGNGIQANGSLEDDVVVTVKTSNGTTGTGHDTSTVKAPGPQQATLAGNILLCSDPNAALPNSGKLVTSGGPTTVANADNTLAPTTVAPGTYHVVATAPTGYHIVVCGDSGANFRDVTLANGESKTVNFFVAPNGSPNISYGKTGPSTGIAGGTGDYAITLTNTGNATAQGPLTFVDVLPVGETFSSVVSATSDAGMSCTAGAVTVNGQVVTCTYSKDLAQNASATVTVRANFAQGTEGQTLRDCVGSTQNTANVCWPTKIKEPKLTITKDGPGSGIPGGNGTYTITVKNTGDGPATAVSFVDNLPAEETFVSASGDFNCQATNDPTKISCTAKTGLLPLNPNGSLSVDVLVKYALTTREGDQLTDCAVLPSKDQACKTTIIHTPDVVIAKTGPATGVAGDRGTYTITVRNNGQATANNVTFTDNLPVGETYFSSTNAQITCSPSANAQVVNCTLNGPLTAGASATVDVTVTYALDTAGKTLTDCAVLAPGNQSCVPTKIPGTPSITVVKTNDADGDGVFHDTETAQNAGDAVTFKVVVTNNGAEPVIIDSVSDAFDATTLAECPQLLNVTLGSGDSVTCTFTIANYAPAAGSSLTDTVTVGGHQTPGGPPVSGSDTSTVKTRVPQTPGPDLAIIKNADQAKVKAGDTLTYTLTVANVGDGPTTGTTTVTDTIPDGLDLVSVSAGSGWSCSTSGRSITCTYAGIVAVGQTLPDITVVTTVNDTAVGSVINTGVVDTPGDTNPLNDRSTVKTPVTKVLPEKIVKPTTPTTTPTTVLPFTGDRTGSMLPVGLAALLFGLMLLVVGRRRRTA